MDELIKIIERYTEGNYLIGNTAKEEMAKDILALFNVVGRSEQLICDCCNGTGMAEGDYRDELESCLTCNGRGAF